MNWTSVKTSGVTFHNKNDIGEYKTVLLIAPKKLYLLQN